MIFHRIRVKNVRGIDEIDLRPAPKGVTVIQGSNEIGKTTIGESVDLIFDELDSSAKQSIKAVQPVGKDVGPEVEIEVETGPYRFTYSKRFLKDRKTELLITSPRIENLSGREAHDRVQQILNETVDVPLWKALRVQQGIALSQPELPEQSRLSQALDKAAGGAPAGAAETTLFEAIKREYEPFYTGGGQERQLLKDARASVDDHHKRLTDIEAQYKSLEVDVKRCGELLREIQNLKERKAEDNGKFTLLEQRWQRVSQLKSKLDTLNAEHVTAEEREKIARLQLDTRKSLVNDLDDLRRFIMGLQKDVEAAAASLEKDQQGVAERRKTLEDSLALAASAQQTQTLRTNDLQFRRNEVDLERFMDQRARIQAAQKQSVQAAAVVATNKMTDAVLEQIRTSAQQVEMARAQLLQMGPRVKLHALRGITLEVNGQEAALVKDQSREEAVSDTLSVRIPGTIEITVSAGTSAQELRKRVAEAQESLEAIYLSAGVKNLTEAVGSNELLKEARRLQSDSEKLIKDLKRDQTVEELDKKIASLQERVEPYLGKRPLEPAISTDVEAAESTFKRAQEVATASALEAESVRKNLETLERGFHERLVQSQVTKVSLDEAHARHSDKQNKLSLARTMATDEALATALADAAGMAEEKRKDFLLAKAEFDKENLEAVQRQHTNAKQALERLERDIQALEKDHASLESRLRTLEEQGLFEKLEDEKSRLEHATRARDQLLRRGRAAKLLFDTMNEARTTAKRAYIGPYRDQVERLGRIVFDDTFAVQVGENLQIERRSLDGRALPFDSLSGGAKEQLGIVARLACSLMVSKDGGGPLFLDDVLGHSDPQRLERMGVLLASAGCECQVIIMTPMPDRFRHIGNATVVRMA